MNHTKLAMDAIKKLDESDAMLEEAIGLLIRLKGLVDTRMYANDVLLDVRAILQSDQCEALLAKYKAEYTTGEAP